MTKRCRTCGDRPLSAFTDYSVSRHGRIFQRRYARCDDCRRAAAATRSSRRAQACARYRQRYPDRYADTKAAQNWRRKRQRVGRVVWKDAMR